MQTVLIVIHLMIVIALVIVVLLQRSEGGALGVGGGSGFMTGRGQANVLTRATAILAALFFATSLGLTLLARYGHNDQLNFNTLNKNQTVLDKLKQFEQQKPQAGEGSPAAPAASGQTPAATPAPATPVPTTPVPAVPAPAPTSSVPAASPPAPTAPAPAPAASAPAASAPAAPAPSTKTSSPTAPAKN